MLVDLELVRTCIVCLGETSSAYVAGQDRTGRQAIEKRPFLTGGCYFSGNPSARYKRTNNIEAIAPACCDLTTMTYSWELFCIKTISLLADTTTCAYANLRGYFRRLLTRSVLPDKDEAIAEQENDCHRPPNRPSGQLGLNYRCVYPDI